MTKDSFICTGEVENYNFSPTLNNFLSLKFAFCHLIFEDTFCLFLLFSIIRNQVYRHK